MTLIFIQARSTSIRFPGKSMAKIGAFPMIHWVLSACVSAGNSHNIVLCIPKRTSENMLKGYVKEFFPSISIFEGEEHDVYQRFKDAYLEFKSDFEKEPPANGLIRVCADRPLLSPVLLSKLLHTEKHVIELLYNHETFKLKGPCGIGGESISRSLSKKFFKVFDSNLIDSEHVTAQLYRNIISLCRMENSLCKLPFGKKVNYSVDTREDLRKTERIMRDFSLKPGDRLPAEQFLEFENFR